VLAAVSREWADIGLTQRHQMCQCAWWCGRRDSIPHGLFLLFIEVANGSHGCCSYPSRRAHPIVQRLVLSDTMKTAIAFLSEIKDVDL